ncbi:MAG: 23S rRNA (guanosine(2251)-2'-O)-methyltransferase RlmB [bacterium TMED88]|nr:23S rRNA (guanosine(2251)-2'-O)-methyltransferase RlmB [Deltaproteobacteria bacterium]OUV28257.1 MAG: 23S rRNA (guanosine(2251)-2'-O)-methyltransferase RlmB [bacterium TMED88]
MSGAKRGAGRKSVHRPAVEVLTGQHVIRAALDSENRKLEHLFVREGPRSPEVLELVKRARSRGLDVSEVPRRSLSDRFGSEPEEVYQGIVLEAGPLRTLSTVDALIGPDRESPSEGSGKREIVVALDGVEDPRNLGAIARVAEAASVLGLLLTDRRSAPLGNVASRASAGAIERLRVCRVPNLNRGLDGLKKSGFWVIGADAAGEQDLFGMPDKLLTGRVAVVMGAEGKGLRPSTLKKVDHRVRIPMQGEVGSLNVSTAAAVILFELLRRESVRDGRIDPGRSRSDP